MTPRIPKSAAQAIAETRRKVARASVPAAVDPVPASRFERLAAGSLQQEIEAWRGELLAAHGGPVVLRAKAESVRTLSDLADDLDCSRKEAAAYRLALMRLVAAYELPRTLAVKPSTVAPLLIEIVDVPAAQPEDCGE
jgi:hypothetical protein